MFTSTDIADSFGSQLHLVGKAREFPGLLGNEIMNDSRKRKISATLDVCFRNNA